MATARRLPKRCSQVWQPPDGCHQTRPQTCFGNLVPFTGHCLQVSVSIAQACESLAQSVLWVLALGCLLSPLCSPARLSVKHDLSGAP